MNAIAGEQINAGAVVYQASNGKILLLKPSLFFRRLLEWLHIVHKRHPLGVVVAAARQDQPVGVMISDTEMYLGETCMGSHTF